MVHVHNIKIPRSVLDVIMFLSLQGWGTLCVALQGCTYSNKVANCDFKHWAPPLSDQAFGGPVHDLSLMNISGTIPDGAFSGLTDPLISTQTYMRLFCGPDGHIRFLRNSFSPNLHWIVNLRINECYIENGLPSRLLENLKSLKFFTIDGIGSEIEGSLAHDALTGLTNLQILTFRSPVKDGTLPAGLFEGLTNLTIIKLINTQFDCIPPNSFNGLVNLKIIELTGNNLTALPDGLFDEPGSLTKVDLHQNPWHCKCELRWLIDWTHVTDRGECATPLSMKGKRLEDALSTLNCTSSTPTFLSKPDCSETEITGTQTNPFHSMTVSYMSCYTMESTLVVSMTVALLTINQANAASYHILKDMITRTATSSQMDWLGLISTHYTKNFGISLTVESTHMTRTISTSATVTTIIVASPTLTSWASSKGTNAMATNTFSNDLRNIALASALGIPIAFLVAGIVIYRSLCWNTRVQSVNPVSNGNETRVNPERRRTNR